MDSKGVPILFSGFEKHISSVEDIKICLGLEIKQAGMTMQSMFASGNGAISPMGIVLSNEGKYAFPLNFEDVDNKFTLVGEVATHFKAFASITCSEAWCASVKKEEPFLTSPSKMPNRIEIVVWALRIYDKVNFINGNDAVVQVFPIIVENGVRKLAIDNETIKSFGLMTLEEAFASDNKFEGKCYDQTAKVEKPNIEVHAVNLN